MKRVGPGRGSSRGGVHGESVAACVGIRGGRGGLAALVRSRPRGGAPARGRARVAGRGLVARVCVLEKIDH